MEENNKRIQYVHYKLYLKLSQEKSPVIGDLPLVGLQQDLRSDWLDSQQALLFTYNGSK